MRRYEASPGAGAGAGAGGPTRPPRTTTAFPPPSAAPTHGPQGVYGYRVSTTTLMHTQRLGAVADTLWPWQYTVKKVFTLGVRREQRHTKRLGYQNPYTEDLRLSIHTDHPHLLTLPKLNYVSLLGCKGTGAKRQLTRCCCVCARSSRPNSARLSSCSSSRSRATGQRATRRSECGSTTRARTKTKSKPAWLPLLFLTIVTRGVFAQVHRLQRQLFDGVRG